MKITPVNLYKSVITEQNQPQIPANSGRFQLKSVPALNFVAYSPEYYLGFKGAPEKSEQHKKLDENLENFFKKSLGERTEFLGYHPYEFYSDSLNSKTGNIINGVIRSIKRSPIDKEMLTKATQKSLNSIRSSENAEKLIEKAKKDNLIPENIAIADTNRAKSYKVMKTLFDAADKSKISLPQGRKLNDKGLEFLFRQFQNTFLNFIYENNKPQLTKEACARIKEAIENSADIRAYDIQTEKIKAQEIKNNFPSSRLCAEKLYEDLMEKHISPFENEKFYDFLALNSEKIDFQIEMLYNSRITGYYTGVFKESGIDEKHKILLIDPGVAFNIEKLAEFVKTCNINTSNLKPIQLRQKFSDYLGTETVYRGLATNEPEKLAEKISRDGNFPLSAKNKEKCINDIEFYLSPFKRPRTSHFDRIVDKITRHDKESEYLSVSSEYPIAASVSKSAKPSKSVVIEARVPKISILKQEKEYRNMQTSKRHDVLVVGNYKYDYDREQEKIEAFIPFYLPNTDMKIHFDTETPLFYWQNFAKGMF